jgi:hypothetical protein
MRRVALIVFLIIGLLHPWPTAIHAPTEVSTTSISVHPDYWSNLAVLPPPAPSSTSPSSFQAVAYVTNISDLVHWQRFVAGHVNVTRQLDLLYSLSSLDSRHPFVEGGNTSIQILTNGLSALGLSVTEDWFPIMRQVWNGTDYIIKPYWTCNLYVCPWGVNAAQPTLVVTCHMDSARNSILGFAPTSAPGADDNAAGVVAVFEALAAISMVKGVFNDWNVVFAFLGGEEGNGTLSLWGSRHLITNGFTLLGVDVSNVLALNIDEIGYSGLFWPTQLALYKYAGESITPLLDHIAAASSLLKISLQDMMNPRVSSDEEVKSYLGWSISEWTFHTSDIPSLTLSTDQYPNPYKHSTNDIASHCSSINLQNASRLIAATIIGLAYNIPSQPSNHISEWMPSLSLSAQTNVIDYLALSEGNYSAYVVDPALNIDSALANELLQLNCPLLALGKAGASLMQLTAGAPITGNGTQSLNVTGYREFHPAIGSPHVLTEEDAMPFMPCEVVYAIGTIEHLLVLVGNTSWCTVGHYYDPTVSPPIFYIGVDSPVDTQIPQIGKASLSWLLEGTSKGLCLGIDSEAPQVGEHTTLYVLMYNFLTWTGIPNKPIQVDVTASLMGANFSTNLVTNESGIASLSLWLQSPTQLEIIAKADTSYNASLAFSPSPICIVIPTMINEVLQGEVISVVCYVNSSWTTPAYVDLSLYACLVGTAVQTNLLLMPGQNIYTFEFFVLPNCPAKMHDLILSIRTSNLILLWEQLPIQVLNAFVLEFQSVPANVTQQESFEITVNCTNRGSYVRTFDIVAADGNFFGSSQVVVNPYSVISHSLSIVYLPSSAIDIGLRLLIIEMQLDGNTLSSIQIELLVKYSTLNLFITLVPPLFLAGLCLLGICWMKNPASTQRHKSNMERERISHPSSGELSSSLAYWKSSNQVRVTRSYPFSKEIKTRISQISHNQGMVAQGPNRFYGKQIALAYEQIGNRLHLTILSSNNQLLQNLLSVFPDIVNEDSEEGES